MNLRLRSEREAREKKEAEEAAARLAGTAGASAARPQANPPIWAEEELEEETIGTELTVENLKLSIARQHKYNYQTYSDADLKAKIKALPGSFKMNSLGERPPRSAYVDAYVGILMVNPSLVPSNIQPDPELVDLRATLFRLTMPEIKKDVLPIFIVKDNATLLKYKQALTENGINPNDNLPLVDSVKHSQIMNCTQTETMRQLMWKVIVDDPKREQKGWGLTNDTITKEGMTTDEIQEVLKKKTHHIIPVIPSNDIPTLLPLVGPTTKEFGFVINSQSDKKSGYALESSIF